LELASASLAGGSEIDTLAGKAAAPRSVSQRRSNR